MSRYTCPCVFFCYVVCASVDYLVTTVQCMYFSKCFVCISTQFIECMGSLHY